MGWASNAAAKVKAIYNKVDKVVGGYLPGGSTPAQVAASKTTTTSSNAGASMAQATNNPSSVTGSNANLGRSSGGGGSSNVTQYLTPKLDSGGGSSVNQSVLMAEATSNPNQLSLSTQANNQVSKVNQFAMQVGISDALNRNRELLLQQKASETYFGSNNQSTYSDPFKASTLTEKEIEKLEQKRKSQIAPTVEELKQLRGDLGKEGERIVGSINDKTGIFIGNIKERLTTTPKITAETANLALRGIKDQELAKYYAEEQNKEIQRLQTLTQEDYNKRMDSKEVQDYYASLQERANNGEDIKTLEKDWSNYQDKIAKEVNNKATEKYETWFSMFQDTAAKDAEKQAMKELIAFNARYGAPRAKEILKSTTQSAKSGAVTGGVATGIVGGLGLFKATSFLGKTGKFLKNVGSKAFGAAAQGTIATGYTVFNLGKRGMREVELQKQYGFTEAEAYRIAKMESTTGFISAGSQYAGFMGGAVLSSTIVSKGLSSIKQAKVNFKKDEFLKDLANNPKLQDKYFTEANLKKGYFDTTIDGAKVRVNIGNNDLAKISGIREGIVNTREVQGLGRDKQLEIINKANQQGLNVDSGMTVSKIRQDAYSRLTGQKVGKGSNSFLIMDRTGQSATGIIFKQDASGKITNLQVVRQKINIKDGTSIIEIAKVGRTPQIEKVGGLIIEGITVRNPRLFASKTITTSQRASGKLQITESDIYLARLKGSKSGKGIQGESATGLFEGNEPLGEFINKPDIFQINPSKAKITQVGKSTRATISKDIDVNLLEVSAKGKVNKFTEKAFTKTPEPLVKFDNVKPPKAAKQRGPDLGFTFETPGKPKGGGSLFDTSASGKGAANPAQLVQQQTSTFDSAAGLAGADYSPSLKLNFKTSITKAPTVDLGLKSGLVYDKGLVQNNKKDTFFTPFSNQQSSQGLFEDQQGKEKTGFIWETGAVNTKSQQSLSQSSAQKVEPILNPIQTQPLIEPLVNPIQQLAPNFNPPGAGFGFGLGTIQVGGGQRGTATKGGLFGQTKYNPSLGSVLLRQGKVKVSKAQAQRLGKQTFSGLEMRPEIEIVNDAPLVSLPKQTTKKPTKSKSKKNSLFKIEV